MITAKKIQPRYQPKFPGNNAICWLIIEIQVMIQPLSWKTNSFKYLVKNASNNKN